MTYDDSVKYFFGVMNDDFYYNITDNIFELSYEEVMDLGQYFGHKKVKFLSNLSCKLLTFFRSQIVNRSMNSFAIIPAFYVLK